jgi:hypothetical protein
LEKQEKRASHSERRERWSKIVNTCARVCAREDGGVRKEAYLKSALIQQTHVHSGFELGSLRLCDNQTIGEQKASASDAVLQHEIAFKVELLCLLSEFRLLQSKHETQRASERVRKPQ